MSKPKAINKRIFFAGMIGNILDHYDMALYTFLVPFIAPVFFPNKDPIIELIMGYGLTIISFISRPAGSIIFGNMVVKAGIKFVLFITLTGVAITTALIGLIPSYDSIGVWSAIILITVRFLQGVFAAGEQTIAGIFLLDQVSEDQRPITSCYYQASSMTGAMMASSVAWFISWTGHGETYWRYAFMTGLITGVIGVLIRFLAIDDAITESGKKIKTHTILIKHRVTILRIILVSILSYVCFAVPFVFLNKFVTVLSDITLTDMMWYNSVIMGLDILLLPVIGLIVAKYDVAKWIAYMTTLLGISAIPAFYMLDKVPFYGIIMIKLWFVIVGLAISGPLRAWFFSLIKTSERYTIVGFAYSIAMSVFGMQTTTICWILWHKTHSIIAPAFYVVIVCIAGVWALLYKPSNLRR